MPVLDLGPAADDVIRLLDGVAQDLLDSPTPCPDFPVSRLIAHIQYAATAMAQVARKEAPSTAGAHDPELDPEWRKVVPQQVEALVAAWREPSAWEGVVNFADAQLPAVGVGAAALSELLLHAWDLSRATGQEFRPDPASIAAVLSFVSAFRQTDILPAGIFGPVVAVADDAPQLDRALGLAGRDPNWTPPA